MNSTEPTFRKKGQSSSPQETEKDSEGRTRAGALGGCLARALSHQSVSAHRASRTAHGPTPLLPPRARSRFSRHRARDACIAAAGIRFTSFVCCCDTRPPPRGAKDALTMKVALVLTLALALLAPCGAHRRRDGRRGSPSGRATHRDRGASRRPSRVAEAQRTQAGTETIPEWPKCEGGLLRVEDAAYVVTGRVEQAGVFTTQIRVRRLLKGVDVPNRIAVSSCRGSCCQLRRRDTRLFLLGEPKESGGQEVYPQVAPPVGVLLKSLDSVAAAAKGT